MNEQELQLLRKLEYIKYITLTTGRIIHSSTAERTHFDNGSGVLTLNTPEGLTLKIKNFRINYKRPDGEGKCSITIDWARDDDGNFAANYAMVPSLPIKEMTNGNKLFVFHSEQFRALPEENRNYYNSEIDNYINSGGFWLHIYSVLIEISQENGHFQAFMNMEYGSDTEIGTWRYFFKQAMDQALTNTNPSIDNLLKYDSRILSNELSPAQSIQILEKFELLNLPNDVIISILNVKESSSAIELINYLRNSNTNLNLRLYQKFLDESSIEDFSRYNDALISLGSKLINQTTIEIIALNEVDTYMAYPNGEWNLFNELAKNAGVFSISTKMIYNTRFGVFNYFPDGVLVNLNPFNTQFLYELPGIPEVNINNNKIHFAYSAIYKSKPLNSNLDSIVRFPEMDPFRIVKLYIVDEPEELAIVENYSGFIEQFLNQEKQKIRVAYLPAICAYNFYGLSFRSQHDEIAATLLQGSLLALGTALTFGTATPYSIPWYLGTAANMTSILAMTINSPGIKQQILDEYGQDGQDFIDAIDILTNATIALDFVHAGFYGIRNFSYFVTNDSIINLAKETFYLRYFQFNLRLRKILMPLFESIGKNIDLVKIQELEFEILLNPHLISGKTWGWVKNYYKINNTFPPLNVYIKQTSITAYNSLFQAEGSVTFFCTKRGIMKYDFLPQGRYAGLSNHMEIVESNFYKSGKNIEQLKQDLGVLSDKFLIDDEIYMIKINFQNGYFFEMPSGIANGTNPEKWLPGGFLPQIKNIETGELFYPRETIFFKNNGENSIINYGDNFQLFLDSFGNGNYKKIYP